jgi:hypothetical protein
MNKKHSSKKRLALTTTSVRPLKAGELINVPGGFHTTDDGPVHSILPINSDCFCL